MNSAIRMPNMTRPISYDRSLRFLTGYDADKPEAFYIGLDFDDRRRRFGGAQSDQSIAQYCRTVDWQRTVIIARGNSCLLDAVLEIHPISQQWDSAEIVMTCPLDGDRPGIFAELLRLAAFTAGGRGYSRFVMYLNPGCCEETGVFADIGRCSCDGEVLSVDLAGYGRTSVGTPRQASKLVPARHCPAS